MALTLTANGCNCVDARCTQTTPATFIYSKFLIRCNWKGLIQDLHVDLTFKDMIK